MRSEQGGEARAIGSVGEPGDYRSLALSLITGSWMLLTEVQNEAPLDKR